MNYAPFKPPFRYRPASAIIWDADMTPVLVMAVSPTTEFQDHIGHRVAELMTLDAQTDERASSAEETPSTPNKPIL